MFSMIHKNDNICPAHNAGSRWFRCDFHVHGPKSDYESITDTPEMWLRAAIDAGLDCVAITDHNSGEWVDDLKDTLQKLREKEGIELVLFPGVEITVQGGWHLLVLFDPSKGRDHVKSFLTEAGIKNDRQGGIDEQADDIKSVLNAAKNHEGICILAHANDSKGLLLHDSGKHKIKVLTNPLLHGIEIKEFEECSKYKEECESGDASRIENAKILFNGTLSNLQEYKKNRISALAQVQFSDNPDSKGHGLRGIGRNSTWIKMSRPDKEGLRLAFSDGAMCCENYNEEVPNLNEYSHPTIKGICVERAYATGLREPLDITFSPWLTTIIGGRGSGKSTVIECLRIGLGKEVDLEQLGENSPLLTTFHDFKKSYDRSTDSGALRPETRITIQYFKDLSLFEIDWSEEGKIISLHQVLPDGSKIDIKGDICQRFPVSIYSQKQIFEIARKPAALLNIIDQSSEVNYKGWSREWEEKTLEFMTLRAKIRELHASEKEISEIEGELSDVNNKISLLENDKNRQIRLAWQRAAKQEQEFATILKEIEDMPKLIQQIISELSISNLTPTNWDQEGSEEKIVNAQANVSNNLGVIRKQIESYIKELEIIGLDFNTAIIDSGWKTNFDSVKLAHEDLVSSLKEQGVSNAEEYGMLLAKRGELEIRLYKTREDIEELPQIVEQTENLRNDLLKKRKELTDNRDQFLNNLAQHLETVKINVEHFGDMESWEKSLRKTIQAQNGFDSTLTPDPNRFREGSREGPRSSNLIERIYSKSVSIEERESEIINIQNLLLNINEQRNNGELNGHFENKIQLQQPETIDRILFTFPNDRINVFYRNKKDSKKWRSISVGSPGQKTAAILTFLLAYGNEPLIIDQPEDDLDNSLIYHLIVEQIKMNKMRRQLMIVTHNPNIPVNGDSELIVVMESMASGGFGVGCLGGLQETQIRNQICDIMEGGEAAFKKRYERIIGKE